MKLPIKTAEKAPKNFLGSLIEPKISLLLTKVSNLLTGQGIKSYLVVGVEHHMLKR